MATCTAITAKGCQCRYKARPGETVCGVHLPKPDVECPVCYETFPGKSRKITTLSCGHKLCQSCCDQWSRQNSTCPMCRAEVLPKQWAQPASPRSLIRSLLGDFDQVAWPPDFDTEEERTDFIGFLYWAFPEATPIQPMPSLEVRGGFLKHPEPPKSVRVTSGVWDAMGKCSTTAPSS